MSPAQPSDDASNEVGVAAAPGSAWTPASWRAKRAAQQPVYPDPDALKRVLEQLARLPPLVTSWEIEALKRHLSSAVQGGRFLLQGGDCSETFEECTSATIIGKLKVLMQMSLVLSQGAKVPVIRVGRIAGQYAKPRSADTETRDGISLPSYRGDAINRPCFTPEGRRPDPELLLRAYERSALTLNFVRALVGSGFADLHHPEYWNLDFIRQSPHVAQYRSMVDAIQDSLRFWETVMGDKLAEAERVDFFTSHEALHLPFEEALTRQVPRRSGWYNLSTHMPWIGHRTHAVDGAHVEYVRGIANPVGVKIGPGTTGEEALALTDILNPQNEPGRLVFICRFGAKCVAGGLPPLAEAVQRRKKLVLWCCDPMHGNTEVAASGVKTRCFDSILSEVKTTFDILRGCGTRLGGVHLELTGENVTECVGGASGVKESDLARDYRSAVDPRLNYDQALELALLLARLLREPAYA